MRHAVNLGLHELDFGAELGARLGTPVRVENDVNAAAFGLFRRLTDAGGSGAPAPWPI